MIITVIIHKLLMRDNDGNMLLGPFAEQRII